MCFESVRVYVCVCGCIVCNSARPVGRSPVISNTMSFRIQIVIIFLLCVCKAFISHGVTTDGNFSSAGRLRGDRGTENDLCVRPRGE